MKFTICIAVGALLMSCQTAPRVSADLTAHLPARSADSVGSGYQGTCGNITITSGVTKVTATKGGDGAQSIGKGYEGEDITKNIDPTANVTQN